MGSTDKRNSQSVLPHITWETLPAAVDFGSCGHSRTTTLLGIGWYLSSNGLSNPLDSRSKSLSLGKKLVLPELQEKSFLDLRHLFPGHEASSSWMTRGTFCIQKGEMFAGSNRTEKGSSVLEKRVTVCIYTVWSVGVISWHVFEVNEKLLKWLEWSHYWYQNLLYISEHFSWSITMIFGSGAPSGSI